MSDTGYSPIFTLANDGSVSNELDLLGSPSHPAAVRWFINAIQRGQLDTQDGTVATFMHLIANSPDGTGKAELDLTAENDSSGQRTRIGAIVDGANGIRQVTILDSLQGSGFVKNAGGGNGGGWTVDRQLDCGIESTPGNGAKSIQYTINHVLGVVPDLVIGLMNNGALLAGTLNYTQFTFDVAISSPALAGWGPGPFQFYWVAIAGLAV